MLRPARPGVTSSASRPRARALAAIAGVALLVATLLGLSGCAASPAAAAHTTFKLDKTCTHDAAGVPTCTIVSSDIAAIPAGTVINYTIVGDGSTKQKNATFTVKDGTASGFCDFNHDYKPLAAQCTFLSGTGVLKGFHLLADVTVTGDPKSDVAVWHWNGTYWFAD